MPPVIILDIMGKKAQAVAVISEGVNCKENQTCLKFQIFDTPLVKIRVILSSARAVRMPSLETSRYSYLFISLKLFNTL